MTVVISHSDYGEMREERTIHHLGREYKNDGVHKYIANYAGGVFSWYEKVTPWGEKEDVKQCPQCDCFHSAYNPPLCFGCATGRK